ncbi:RtcB family protein [Patescibacteria group bacterium]
MEIINKEEYRVPVFSWCRDIDEGTMRQVGNLAELPFVVEKIALMSDCHVGYGMPIGGVMATEGVVVPNAVGRDIGCGMCAVKTSLTEVDIEILKKVMGEIRRQVPVGFKHHKKKQDVSLMPSAEELYANVEKSIVQREFEKARTQIGTLGGGNHFVEIQKGSDGFIWIMVHSGSRNVGKQVAEHYNDLAIKLNERWKSEVTKEKQLAFLLLDSNEGRDYMMEMEWCVKFSFANRKLMMDRIKKIFKDKLFESEKEEYVDLKFEPMINIAHNYAAMERHFGKNVVVHRKGATSAREGEFGLIPGSQGTKSYVVRGLGNPDSFMSCSHGSGRKMGRKQAQRELDLEEEKRKLDDQGILHAIRGKWDLEEASGAYKDINIVMEDQADLVDIVVELTPMGVVKG